MKISDVIKAIDMAWSTNPHLPIYVEGPPGGGKTQLGLQLPVLVAYLTGYTPIIIKPSDRDSSDFLGIPDLSGKVVKWMPPEELHQFSKGKFILIVDELSDCPVPTQNVLCGLMLERKTANVTLSDEVRIYATGNRVEDRSGAQRLVTKLGNRVMRLQLTTDQQDWKQWAYNNGISPALNAFIQLRPDLLHQFDPDQFSNPSPRSWEMLDKTFVFDDMPLNLYLECAQGLVGHVAAPEYVNYLKLLPDMPDVADIIANPTTAPIPTDPSLMFAIVTAFIKRVDAKNIDAMFDYMARENFGKDFRAMFITDVRMSEQLVAQGLHEHKRITELALESAQTDLTQ